MSMVSELNGYFRVLDIKSGVNQREKCVEASVFSSNVERRKSHSHSQGNFPEKIARVGIPPCSISIG